MIRRMVEGMGFLGSGRHGTDRNTDNSVTYLLRLEDDPERRTYILRGSTWEVATSDELTALGVSRPFLQQPSTGPSTATEPPTDNAEDDRSC